MTLLNKLRRLAPILIAEDDEEDRELIKEAFDECGLSNDIIFVNDGVELMDYLQRVGKYSNKQEYPFPGIILLDLNMPKKDGRQVLLEMKADNELRKIPVTILTTSKSTEDVLKSYRLGVNSFIIKPVTFDALVNVLNMIGKYWFEIVELPL